MQLNRIEAFDREEVLGFYDKLEELLEIHNFAPSNFYNADETGITAVDAGKILTKKGQR